MTDPDHDARLILANALSNLAPHTYMSKRSAAAQVLVAEFVALAKSLGSDVSKDRDGNDMFGLGGGAIVIFIGGAAEISLRYLNAFDGSSSPHAIAAELEYDPLADAIVGKHVDTDIAPTPGERFPRVRPLKVLATLAAQLADAKT
jgi:hypothetical protein